MFKTRLISGAALLVLAFLTIRAGGYVLLGTMLFLSVVGVFELYRALGIPEKMFTVMFALARLPGWIAHWREMIGMNTRIVRPRQVYVGKKCDIQA